MGLNVFFFFGTECFKERVEAKIIGLDKVRVPEIPGS